MQKFRNLIGLLILLLTVALVCPALGQGSGGGAGPGSPGAGVGAGPGGGPAAGPGSGMGPGAGMGPRMGMGRGMGAGMYDPKNEATITGTVQTAKTAPTRRMRHEMIILKTAQGDVTVHLGPAWYMNQQNFVPKPGETMEVTGSKITTKDGKIAMIARELKLGGKTLKLRDEQGLPAWGRGGPAQ